MKTIEIRRAQETPDLNGDLSQPAWKNAAWYGGFVLADRPDTAAPDPTEFAVLCDAENLYVAVKTTVTDPDDQPHWDYVKIDPRGEIQMMIDSEGTGRRTVLFCLAGDGSAWGRWMDAVSNLANWPGEIRRGFRSEGNTWIVQFAVGLADFRHASAAPQWKFNLVRIPARNVPQMWSTYVPLKQALDGVLPSNNFFLPPNVTGCAEFENPGVLEPFLWAVTRTGRARVMDTANGRVCRQEIRVTNLADAARSVVLRAGFPDSQDAPPPLAFAPNQTRVETLDLSVPAEFECGQLTVSLAEPGDGRCLSRNEMLVEAEPLSWKEHFIRRRDGKGGWTCHPARMRFVPWFEGCKVTPFGLAQMDNGEIVLAGSAGVGSGAEQAVVAFSRDGGATWSDYLSIEGCHSRPINLACLGRGRLIFCGPYEDSGINHRFFSSDYGRTWEHAPIPPPYAGGWIGYEGNVLVDRDANGAVTGIAETGYIGWGDGNHPQSPTLEVFRWSRDGGRTWEPPVQPGEWLWQATYGGKTYTRGVSEGALVRTANGWIVAALRTDCHPAWLEHPSAGDNQEGTGISISRDDGRTWSPVRVVFDAGRMHANLVRLPNGDLVMTVIRRIDIRDGKLISYRKGCDAVISRDNGLTWDVEHVYTLDDFAYLQGERWTDSLACGHLFSTVLGDGSILTAFGNYLAGGELINWKPAE